MWPILSGMYGLLHSVIQCVAHIVWYVWPGIFCTTKCGKYCVVCMARSSLYSMSLGDKRRMLHIGAERGSATEGRVRVSPPSVLPSPTPGQPVGRNPTPCQPGSPIPSPIIAPRFKNSQGVLAFQVSPYYSTQHKTDQT